MKPDNKERILHILDAIEKIEEYSDGKVLLGRETYLFMSIFVLM